MSEPPFHYFALSNCELMISYLKEHFKDNQVHISKPPISTRPKADHTGGEAITSFSTAQRKEAVFRFSTSDAETTESLIYAFLRAYVETHNMPPLSASWMCQLLRQRGSKVTLNILTCAVETGAR